MSDNRFYYDLIPEHVFSENCKILELGSGDGSSQLASRHAERFKNNYVGIDKRNDIDPKLNVIQADILSFQPEIRHDLLLLIAFLEHIPFSQWQKIKELIAHYTNANGYVVIVVPDDQHLENYYNSLDYFRAAQYDSIHEVFSITQGFLERWMPKMQVRRIYRPVRWKGRNWLTSLFRWVQCVLTRKFKRQYVLLGVWKKED